MGTMKTGAAVVVAAVAERPVKFITQVHLMTVLNLILHMTGENLLSLSVVRV